MSRKNIITIFEWLLGSISTTLEARPFFERAQFYLQKCLVPKQVLRADGIISYYLTSKTEFTKGDGNLDPWKT